MRKILTVARWEFAEKVKTKSFLISLLLTPAIIIAFTILPALLAGSEGDSTEVVGLIDQSGLFFNNIKAELEQYQIDGYQPAYLLVNFSTTGISLQELKKEADSMVIKGNIEGYLAVSRNGENYKLEYRSMNPGNLKHTKRFEKAFNNARIKFELNSSGLDPEVVGSILSNVDLKEIRLDKSGKENESGFLEIFFTSFIFIMILVLVILTSGGMLIRSVVEEKSNRLIEILVSSCTPEELLTGKILGLSSLALFQLLIWSTFGAALSGYNMIPASAFNNIGPMFIYFILGFLLYTALFVGIGSIVNTEQEAQQVTGYLSLLLLMPVVFAISTIENPDSELVKVLTYIPLTTPAVMLLKLNIKLVPLQELIITVSVLLFSIILIVYITARIFRIGILSYGKAPNVKQLIQWIKEK